MTIGQPTPHPHWRRHVALFLGGQTVTLFGSMLVQYAVFWYLAIAYQSGVTMTLAAVFGFLPQAVVSVFAGVWADRTNRKWLIVGADAAIAASTLVLALVLLAGFAEPWIIFVTLAIRSAGAGVQTPAVSALIPQITPADQLMRVNGILGSLQSALALLGPPVAGAIYAVAATGSEGSPTALVPVFAIDIVTAIAGIGMLALIPVASIRAAGATAGYVEDLVAGVRYVATHAFVRWLLVVFAIIFVLTVAPSNLTPLMLVRSFPSGEQGNVVNLALLEMSFSVGMVVGGVLIATIASGWNRIGLIAGSSLVFGGLSIALGLAPSLWIFFGVMLLIGLAVPVLLDAVDDAAPGDGGARDAGARVRVRGDRDGAGDAVRDAGVRAAGRCRAGRDDPGRGGHRDVRGGGPGAGPAGRPAGDRSGARDVHGPCARDGRRCFIDRQRGCRRPLVLAPGVAGACAAIHWDPDGAVVREEQRHRAQCRLLGPKYAGEVPEQQRRDRWRPIDCFVRRLTARGGSRLTARGGSRLTAAHASRRAAAHASRRAAALGATLTAPPRAATRGTGR